MWQDSEGAYTAGTSNGIWGETVSNDRRACWRTRGQSSSDAGHSFVVVWSLNQPRSDPEDRGQGEPGDSPALRGDSGDGATGFSESYRRNIMENQRGVALAVDDDRCDGIAFHDT